MGEEKNLIKESKVDWKRVFRIITWVSGINFIVLFTVYLFVLMAGDKIGYTYFFWIFSFVYIPLSGILSLIIGLIKIKKVSVALLILLVNIFIGFLLFNLVLKIVHFLEKLF